MKKTKQELIDALVDKIMVASLSKKEKTTIQSQTAYLISRRTPKK